MSNIKSLLDDIINDTNNSYTDVKPEDAISNNEIKFFDKGAFREKLSKLVLKDIVHAMMHDEVSDVDEMIDTSIMKHIHDDYKGTCFGYLNDSCKKTNSPLIQDVIQEIDNKTNEIADDIKMKKCDDCGDSVDVKDIVKNVDSYEELRNKLKEKVSNKVIDDVAKVIATSNDAPVFNNLDDKLEKIDDDVTSESMILKMSGKIVLEEYMETKTKMDTETATSHAIVEYCINEMDTLFKQHDMTNLFHAKYAY